MAFRVSAAGLSPAHGTICRFREEHLNQCKRLLVQVVQLAKEAGLVRMGTIAIDGSKVKANASKHKTMSYDPHADGGKDATQRDQEADVGGA